MSSQTATIRIQKRTLTIADQTYTLSNIARVQVAKVPKPSDEGKGNVWVAVGAGCLSFVVVGFAITLLTASLARNGNLGEPSMFIPLLAGGGVAYWAWTKTARHYPEAYALILETTGNPIVALVSSSKEELETASSAISAALEAGGGSGETITINNVYNNTTNVYNQNTGDAYNAFGPNSTGRRS